MRLPSELLAAGVPGSHIVPAWHAPHERKITGFATGRGCCPDGVSCSFFAPRVASAPGLSRVRDCLCKPVPRALPPSLPAFRCAVVALPERPQHPERAVHCTGLPQRAGARAFLPGHPYRPLRRRCTPERLQHPERAVIAPPAAIIAPPAAIRGTSRGRSIGLTRVEVNGFTLGAPTAAPHPVRVSILSRV